MKIVKEGGEKQVGGDSPSTTVTLVGAWKCCLPWCGATDSKASSNRKSSSPIDSPIETEPYKHVPQDVLTVVNKLQRSPQQAPLTDILEEDSDVLQEDEERTPLQPLGSHISFQKKKNASPILSGKPSGVRKYQAARTAVNSAASSETGVGGSALEPRGRMQAEQGTIGDLQKYHNRYLRNRRHTLANVR
ncbi:hypothetical protein ABEB36_012100 [Hypothenemus hampei]|uniref:Uncharacterized protein n=1 Tax=Hypothenemus hampei TaxID=57062 RepID=A0ABD1EA38_HYPHA